MWKKENIQEELLEITPNLAAVPRVDVFTVPEGYFMQFPASVTELVSTDEESFGLPQVSAANAYKAPEGYFDGLAGSIIARIKQNVTEENEVEAELRAVAPLLATMSRADVYTVSAGYFAQLDVPLGQQHETAKVVRMSPVRRVLQYAVAAVVIAFMAIGGYLFFDKDIQPVQPTAEVSIDAALETLSDKEIAEYLEKHAVDYSSNNVVLPDTEFDVNEMVEDLSDEELQHFLNKNPEPAKPVSKES